MSTLPEIERDEWLAARDADPAGYDSIERYDPADDAPEPFGPRPADPYTGTCGGCGQGVSTRSEGGSCIWRGGAWHPACRVTDKAAGGTASSPAPARDDAQGVIDF